MSSASHSPSAPRHTRRIDLACLSLLLAVPWLWFNRALLPSLSGVTFLPYDNLYAFQPFRGLRPDIVPHNPLISDLVLQSVPWALHTRRALAHGALPLWNPDLLAGTSFLAADQPAVLYPLGLLVDLLPVSDGFGIFIALHLALAGMGLYLFGRIRQWAPAACLMAGLAFMLGGFSITSVTFPQVIASAAWTPLVLVVVETLLVRAECPRPAHSPWLWPAGVLCVGLQMLAGHLEIALYGLLFVGSYTALRLVQVASRTRSVGRVLRVSASALSLVLLGGGLGAAQIVPFSEALTASVRVGIRSADEVLILAWPVSQLWSIVLPDVFGNPTHRSWLDLPAGAFRPSVDGQPIFWGVKNYVEGGQYVGIVTLVLATVGLLKGRRESALLLGILAAVALLLVLGSPLYRLVLTIPGADALRSPFRWVFPLSLCLSLLAGLGLNVLLQSHTRLLPRIVPVVLLTGGGVIAGSVLVSLVVPQPALKLSQRLVTDPTWAERVFGHTARQLPAVFSSAPMFWGYQSQGLLRLGLALVGSALVVWLVDHRPPAASVAALLLLCADVWSVHGGFFPQTDIRLSPEVTRPPLVSALADWTAGTQPWRFTTVENGDEKTLLANVGMYFGWQDIRGYDSIITRQYAAFTERLGLAPQELDFNRIGPIHNHDIVGGRLLDLLNVRYIISEHALNAPNVRQVYRDSEVFVYENVTALPRAFVAPEARVRPVADQPLENLEPLDVVYLDTPPADDVSDDGGRGTARVTDSGTDGVTVAVTLDGPAWLVLADNFAPGWTAVVRPVDGPSAATPRNVDVVRAYGTLRAVHVPERGTFDVQFSYTPRSVRVGMIVSLASMAMGVAVSLIWLLLRNKKKVAASAHSGRHHPLHAP